ncbi:AraC family transcriptional regulator [Luteimonas aquatica]|uniref:AraC family transcriptional regulator n=1 Tax=Luteimonas aquatica TaxID=450364 RepID=UPI001F576EB2|nr:AraC family transcriptional regulator [Luteimonas aquatica]
MQHPPADPRLTTASNATNILSGLCQLADEQAVACEPWFSGLRLTRAQIDDAGVRVSYRQASRIVQRALRALPFPDLGLRLGSRQNIGNFGLLGLAMMTARTFGEAVGIGLQYAPISGGLMDVEMDASEPGAVAMVAHQRAQEPQILPFLCEELFVSTLMLCRGLVGAEFAPRRLELTYAAPAYAAQYRPLFGCEIRFGMPRNRVIIDGAWMQRPLPTYNPVSAQQALALCRAMMPSGQGASEIVATVRNLLRERMAESPRLADIAADLHLTERTLRRQLSAAGAGFKEIHDQLRSERARDLLHEGQLSIAQIGARVGFRDAREFRRAFKRWTGVAPREARGRG